MENVWNNQDAVVGHGKDITLQVSHFNSLGVLTDMVDPQARIVRDRGRRRVYSDRFL